MSSRVFYFSGIENFEKLGLSDPTDFDRIVRYSVWATSFNEKDGGDDPDDEHSHPEPCGSNALLWNSAIGEVSQLSEDSRKEIGRKCKFLLNAARVIALRNMGCRAELAEYISRKVTKENVLMIVKWL